MYIVIKKDKAEKLEEKLYKMKECISMIADMFEEAKEERYEQEDYYRERARGNQGGGGRSRARDYEDDDDDYRDMARGRSGGGRGRSRY